MLKTIPKDYIAKKKYGDKKPNIMQLSIRRKHLKTNYVVDYGVVKITNLGR